MKFKEKLNLLKKTKEEKVTLEEGVEVTIREMTGVMRDYYDQNSKDRVQFKGKHPDLNTLNVQGQRALLVSMHLVDDSTGELAFDYLNNEHLAEINGFCASMVEKIVDAAVKLSGLEVEDEDEKKSEQAEQSTSG